MKTKGSKGAVTIFITLILVPMLLITSIFIDASRVQYAKTMVQSTEDLTLNTIAASYDTQLKDLYGLFGSVQNVEELYNDLEDYFTDMIEQSGLDKETSSNFAKNIIAGLKKTDNGTELSNFLDVDYLQGSSVDISALDGGNLTNTAILEQQIVDFMKYRTPINTGLDFITSLKTLSTLEDQKKVIDAKEDYYQEVKTINEKLKIAWVAISNYTSGAYLTDNEGIANNPSYNNPKEYLEAASKLISSYGETYNEAVRLYVMNVSSNKFYGDYYFFYDGVYENCTSGSKNKIRVSYSPKRPTSASNISTPASNFNTYYEQCKDYLTNGEFVIEAEGGYLPQVWLKNSYNTDYANFGKAFKNLLVNFNKYKTYEGGIDLIPTDTDDEEKNEANQELIDECEAALDGAIDDEFQEIASAFASLTSKLRPAYESYEKNYYNSLEDISSYIDSIYSSSNEIDKDLKLASDYLGKAIKYLKDALSISNNQLESKKSAWKSAADGVSETTIGQDSLAEIENLNDEYVNEETINKLIGLLETLQEEINSNKAQLDAYKYCSSSIIYIGSSKFNSDTYYKFGESNLKSLSNDVQGLKTEANNFYADHFTSGDFDIKWATKTNPDLSDPSNLKDQNFYQYLYQKFGETSKNVTNDNDDDSKATKTDGKDQYDEWNSKGEKDSSNSGLTDKTKNEPSSLTEIGESNTVQAADGSSSSAEDALDNNSMMDTGNLFDELANLAENFRDKFYVADYIMGMFSYSTIEEEAKKEAELKKKVSKASDSDKVEVEIQTLTFEDINSTNNKLYPYEIEYIVFGCDNNSSNVLATCASIYGIRFLLNTIYAFTSKELKAEASTTAAAISAASWGIIPEPLIKTIILVAYSCIESGIDLYNLKQGESVILYKTKDTWNTSMQNLAGEVVKKLVDEGAEDLKVFLNGAIDDLSEYTDEELKNIETYLTNQFNEQVDSISSGAIDIVTSAYEDAKAKIGMENGKADKINADEVSELIKVAVQNWSESGETGLQKCVKELVANAVIQQIDSYVQDMLSKDDNIIKNASQKIKNAIDSVINDSASKIQEYKNEYVNKIKDAMAEGVDSLADTLSSVGSEYFGGTDTGEGSTNSLLSFTYSDYLRFFCMAALYTNEDGVLTRTGTLIQANMIIKDDDFKLSKSVVYSKISGTIKVKPLLINLDLFSDYNLSSSTNYDTWNNYTFERIGGY